MLFSKDFTKQLERKDNIIKNPLLCPNCKDEQVQILNYTDKPAVWKCRSCKFIFEFEPKLCYTKKSTK